MERLAYVTAVVMLCGCMTTTTLQAGPLVVRGAKVCYTRQDAALVAQLRTASAEEALLQLVELYSQKRCRLYTGKLHIVARLPIDENAWVTVASADEKVLYLPAWHTK